MDKCREEFEHYMLKSGYTEYALSKSNHYDCYHDITIDAMYSAWKASRESMKAIKLPERIPLDRYYTNETDRTLAYNCAINECKDAITSAGYKVEE